MLRKHRTLIMVVVVLFALAASAVVGFMLVGRESQPSFVDNLVFIPIVIGKPEQDASAALEAAGLRAEIRYEPRALRKSEGLVIGQIQPSRPFTSKGSSIVLIVARR
jgi:beta-lactam-binding protein with PASTA domain